ncbi:nitrate reductase molybdenum cofactor assembly chaperone [Azospirillum ramasamyi]|uniref:Nitrate reductase molybdenum cofactor assembly chaperone n=1 Tax=Azospirillum ramasamyi TaxID=682998 RepID=A0A2U9SCX6_9PROT|nr:nitrate reductase molybdenum cofactor assembly chaperone [Azospirillum ramasamyi]AWU96881.1 nitrate reductase molybdenum cofactor assembly chaperone [Azospirillum ramasamyi]
MLAAKALAGLLLYPGPALIEALPEIAAVLRASGLPDRDRNGVAAFCDGLASTDLLEAQSTYIALFDRNPSLSLYLFGHVHGDSRERGQAMADLVADYNRMGLELTGDELPDYIPVFLEFASLHGEAEARALIGEIAEVVALLAERLEKRGSPYAAVFRAVETLGGRQADRETIEARLSEPEPADTPEALDAQYEEAPVNFMEPAAADSPCSKAAALVREFNRDLPPARATDKC